MGNNPNSRLWRPELPLPQTEVGWSSTTKTLTSEWLATTPWPWLLCRRREEQSGSNDSRVEKLSESNDGHRRSSTRGSSPQERSEQRLIQHIRSTVSSGLSSSAQFNNRCGSSPRKCSSEGVWQADQWISSWWTTALAFSDGRDRRLQVRSRKQESRGQGSRACRGLGASARGCRGV